MIAPPGAQPCRGAAALAPQPFAARGPAHRLDLDAENAQRGLVGLVLTLLQMVYQLLLRQSLRRLENGKLSEEQAERLGSALMRLEQTLEELKEHFGLTDGDLEPGASLRPY